MTSKVSASSMILESTIQSAPNIAQKMFDSSSGNAGIKSGKVISESGSGDSNANTISLISAPAYSSSNIELKQDSHSITLASVVNSSSGTGATITNKRKPVKPVKTSSSVSSGDQTGDGAVFFSFQDPQLSSGIGLKQVSNAPKQVSKSATYSSVSANIATNDFDTASNDLTINNVDKQRFSSTSEKQEGTGSSGRAGMRSRVTNKRSAIDSDDSERPIKRATLMINDMSSAQANTASEPVQNPKKMRRPKTCQSCGIRTITPKKVAINPHYNHDTFYRSYAMFPQLADGSPYLLAAQDGYQHHNGYRTVSVKPTTAAISSEKFTLCECCHGRFMQHRLMCDSESCHYVPSNLESKSRDCVNCFDGIVTKH